MKRIRIFQELVFFVIIAFAFTTINFFAIQESYAHQLCSGCPTEDSGETYCYDCNSPHPHLDEAKKALDSEISNAQMLITSIQDMVYEVEGSAPDDVVDEIALGLRDLAFSLGGAIAAALAVKATLASAGTLSPAGYWAAAYSIGVSFKYSASSFQHFSNAWTTHKYHTAEVTCPECERTTTQAALNGDHSYNPTHVIVHCHYQTNNSGACYIGSHDLSDRGVYRNCRVGGCPNAHNHYDTEN